jgi:hypothetical protein
MEINNYCTIKQLKGNCAANLPAGRQAGFADVADKLLFIAVGKKVATGCTNYTDRKMLLQNLCN